MKKIEMEEHRENYHHYVALANASIQQLAFTDAISHARESWNYVDGMLQYEKKYEDKGPFKFKGISIVLKYAPMFFDYDSLSELEQLLKNCKRIEKNSKPNLKESLSEANERILDIHGFWNYLESNKNSSIEDICKSIGRKKQKWLEVIEVWNQVKILSVIENKGEPLYSLYTRMSDPIDAKCPRCGKITSSAKEKLLKPVQCNQCQNTVHFHFIYSCTS